MAIPNNDKWLEKSLVVLSATTTVAQALQEAQGNRFVVVDFGATTPRYQILVAAALPGLPADQPLQKAGFGFRPTQIIQRSETTTAANAKALSNPKTSFLVVKADQTPIGIFKAQGSNLGDPEPQMDTFTITCRNGHSNEITFLGVCSVCGVSLP